jgi:cellulose synthase/poly-beta-1,6-N-acetylglucosamine synthase-like glycosyltransferase
MASSFDSVGAVLIWLSLAALFYVYIGYPLLLSLIAIFFRSRQAPLGYFPTISVLIAAYNEEGGLRKKIDQTLALDYPTDRIEIIVLSDCSTDRTDEIVKSFNDSRVRLFRAPIRKGKTNAQNLGVEIAKGEVLVFSDATTVYHPLALQFLTTNYVDPKVGAVSGRYQYFDPEGKSPTGSGMIAFWNYENFIKTIQSRIRTISGCCGCIYSVRREAYTSLQPDIISDLVQPLCVIQKGYRVVFENRALAYEETTKSSKEEFSMRVRVVTRGIRGVLSVRDLLNPAKHGWVSFQLLSHKVLRWLVPFFLIMLFTSNAVLWSRSWYGLLFGLQVAFYAFALLAMIVPMHLFWKPLGLPLYFCTLNAAALRSILEVVRGRKYAVWETARGQL